MSDAKFVMLTNIIMRCTLFICVTMAAMHFENATILWWYIMALFMGYEYRETPKGE